MSWKEDYIYQKFISREVVLLTNEHNDEIEMEIVQFHNHYHVYATICNESGDFDGEGRDLTEREAARKALKELYHNAYNR